MNEKINDILDNNKIKSSGKYKASVQRGVKISGVTKNQFKKLESEFRKAGIKSAYALQKYKNAQARAKRRASAQARKRIREENNKKRELISMLKRIKRNRWSKQSEDQWAKIPHKGKLNKEEFLDFVTDMREYNLGIVDAIEDGMLPKLTQPLKLPKDNSKGEIEKFMERRKSWLERGVQGKIDATWNKLARNLSAVYGNVAPQIYLYMQKIGMRDIESYFEGRGVPLYWLLKSDIPGIDDAQQKDMVIREIENELDSNELITVLSKYITIEEELEILNKLEKTQRTWNW